MIKMTLVNSSVFIWDSNDWMKLRKDHRIVGNLIGCLAHLPRQNSFSGLPLVLLPEEVTLLLEKKLGILVTPKNPCSEPSENVKKVYKEYVERVNKEQLEYYEEERKKQVTSMIDRIVEGKKRKIIGLNTKRKKPSSPDKEEELRLKEIELDKEAILKTELEKGPVTNPVLVQTCTADPWYTDSDFDESQWNFPNKPHEHLKYRVFKDLWERNYYITSGKKFGGDFLVYPGEPVTFHSHFIVLCQDKNQKLSMSDLILHSRLGSSTRKTFVIAYINTEDEVKYHSYQWSEIS